MTTVRELCRVLSATLHLPDTRPWVDQLVARELLPGLDHKVTTLDAALLLRAVVAAPNHADTPRVVVALANLPRMSTMRRVDGPEIETWARGAKRADDGFWYVKRDGKFLRVQNSEANRPLDIEAQRKAGAR